MKYHILVGLLSWCAISVGAFVLGGWGAALVAAGGLFLFGVFAEDLFRALRFNYHTGEHYP